MTTKLEAQWITGFVDGEGCFFIGLNTNIQMSVGFQVLPEFVVVQHKRDEQILQALKAFWGCGVVRKNHGDRLCYRVRGLKDIKNIIIPFFEKHSLKTKKKIDFLKFRRVLQLIDKNEHLKVNGLLIIDKIRLTMNTGPKSKKKLVLINDKLIFENI